MATVIGKTSSRIDELLADLVTETEIIDGRLVVTKRSGAVSDMGAIDLAHNHDDLYFTEAESDARFAKRLETSGNVKRAWSLVQYGEAVSGGSGDIVIQTNLTFGNYMTNLEIKGFNYYGGNSIIDLTVNFYAFESTSFVNVDAVNKGTLQFSNVRLMRRTSDNKIAIVLTPAAGLLWEYPKLVVDGIFGHTIPTDAMLQGWTITRTTSLAAYTAMTTVSVTSYEERGIPTGSKVSWHTGPTTHLPNDEIARTTHLLTSIVTIPNNAVTMQLSMQVNAHCSYNAQTWWAPCVSLNNGSSWLSLYEYSGLYIPSHNHTNPGTNIGFAHSSIFDVRAARGGMVALAVNGRNDAGSGSWTYVGNLTYTLTFLS